MAAIASAKYGSMAQSSTMKTNEAMKTWARCEESGGINEFDVFAAVISR
jgi:hypothetical protein